MKPEPDKKPKPKKKEARPIFLVVRKMVDPATGEEVGCYVPANQGSRDEGKRRKYTVGTRLKAELTRPRNILFWRKAHVLAELCIEHIDAFTSLDQHAALKKLQLGADAECDHIDFLIPGNPIRYRQARTLAFDSMDEGVFTQVYDKIVEHIKDRYFPEWDDDQMQQLIDLTDQKQNWP